MSRDYFINLSCVITSFLFSLQLRKGARVSNDEILSFAKLFNDELTLDNISRLALLITNFSVLKELLIFFTTKRAPSFILPVLAFRPRLVNMCKYMGISPFGTDAYLRYMLRKRLQR